MTDKELINKLSKIGYTMQWLDYGVLTPEYLLEQEKIFDEGEDQNTEYYRYQTFRQYLSSKTELSDTEFENYLQLTITDPDPLMAGAAAVDLFSKVDLTDAQFQKLCNTIKHFGAWTDKVVSREKLLRQLKTSKLTAGLFKECIENGDSVIHEYILGMSDTDQLQELVTKAKNKRIRNMANEKLKRLAGNEKSR